MRPVALAPPIEPGGVVAAWTLDPVVLVSLLLAAWAYGYGVHRLWTKGRGRGVGPAQVFAFSAGLVALAVALVSPIASLGHTLFAAHMVQHLILVLVAAPLLVLGAPFLPCSLALPRSLRRDLHALGRTSKASAFWAVLTGPLVVWIVHVGALWAWHLPALYEAALRSQGLHAVEHLSFFFTALLFWSLIISFGRPRLPYPARLGYVFVTTLQSGGLGALLTFASVPLYSVHAAGARAWGLSALQDQQLAGVIMWIPAGVVYLASMSLLFTRWLRAMDKGAAETDARKVALLPAGRRP
ncbi:MAG: cytochrome c oxidase assembly protein [Actinobacteria bacterium]|nr:cytochrome c oxidase assembly protein [Actinomycetota bacterium]